MESTIATPDSQYSRPIVPSGGKDDDNERGLDNKNDVDSRRKQKGFEITGALSENRVEGSRTCPMP
jgi:hypothetical protein